jgi:ribosomal protein S8
MNKNILLFLNDLKQNANAKKFSMKLSFSQKITPIIRTLYILGYIQSYHVKRKNVYLKTNFCLLNLKFFSKPSVKRYYLKFSEISNFQQLPNNVVIFFSTNKGILTNFCCKRNKLGGVPLFVIW